MIDATATKEKETPRGQQQKPTIGVRELAFHGQDSRGENQHEEVIKQMANIQEQEIAFWMCHDAILSDHQVAV